MSIKNINVLGASLLSPTFDNTTYDAGDQVLCTHFDAIGEINKLLYPLECFVVEPLVDHNQYVLEHAWSGDIFVAHGWQLHGKEFIDLSDPTVKWAYGEPSDWQLVAEHKHYGENK
tara:strand:- start:220 stop:567 length:348 start_codon:yes stop_codon:yes gene_type:complete